MFDIQGSRGEFLKILADVGEEPAFIQRARSVEIGWDMLLSSCESQRDELLQWPRRHFAILAHRVRKDWSRLVPYLKEPRSAEYFEPLHRAWESKLPTVTDWTWSDRAALFTFVASVERFNHAWAQALRRVDLEEVNRVRGDYNRFYPIEKDCAFGIDRTALTFEPIEMVTPAKLRELFPPVALPELR
ncbi:MAG: hypothetical protein ACO1RT_20260 [Planctomycetaceae bacterium]